ncbi:TIGR00725 family protein [Pelotomaculum propionicicum]|uniref:TIGR00725 family protein n=1 Tax=Pelotomaculum propionicicum TaxID=258475 RepID=UPI003B7D2942
MSSYIVGVIGGGEDVLQENYELAYRLGGLIAKEGWVLLNGGRPAGIMESSARGAKESGGLTVGVLPGRSSSEASAYIDIAIITGMGSARNNINVLSSDVIIALPGKAGTISEIALALKNGKKVLLLNFDPGSIFAEYRDTGLLQSAGSPEEAISIIKAGMGSCD